VPALLWSGHGSSSTKFYDQLCQSSAESRKDRVCGRSLTLPTARREGTDSDCRLKSDAFHYDYWILWLLFSQLEDSLPLIHRVILERIDLGVNLVRSRVLRDEKTVSKDSVSAILSCKSVSVIMFLDLLLSRIIFENILLRALHEHECSRL
jgi:hypothetical protein